MNKNDKRLRDLEAIVIDRPGVMDSAAANAIIDEICTYSGTTVAQQVAYYGGEIEFLAALCDMISTEQERRLVRH